MDKLDKIREIEENIRKIIEHSNSKIIDLNKEKTELLFEDKKIYYIANNEGSLFLTDELSEIINFFSNNKKAKIYRTAINCPFCEEINLII